MNQSRFISRTASWLRRRSAAAALLVAAFTGAPSALAQPAKPAEPDVMGPNDPLAGFTDQTAFIRSADNMFVLLPNGRLQVDAYVFARPTEQMPEPTVLLRRARLELAGWVGPWFFYNLAGDFALGAPAGPDPRPQSFIASTDDYIGFAPLGDHLVIQAGQFDAPFTLENRTSDKYIHFMERALTVRAFGVPSNKELGVMAHGLPLTNRFLYYSLGFFNGDGQNFRNVDTNFDVIGRGWIAPFALTNVEALKNVTIGGSFWKGRRGETGLALAAQTTQGGFNFLNPRWNLPDVGTPAELHQRGDLTAWAVEANIPIAHRIGLRFELVRKVQQLAEDDISAAATGMLRPLGAARLDGWSMYGELSSWVIGDDRILPDPGLQLPPRLRKFKTTAPRHGLQLVARVDNLDETITTTSPKLNDPNVGRTHVIAPALGVNYWYSRRFRATFNYVSNVLDGDAASIQAAKQRNGDRAVEHEFLFRLGIAL